MKDVMKLVDIKLFSSWKLFNDQGVLNSCKDLINTKFFNDEINVMESSFVYIKMTYSGTPIMLLQTSYLSLSQTRI